MIDPARTTLVLLAAGQSLRFGAADKLSQPLGDRPLGLHVVAALARIRFARRIAVVGEHPLDFAAHGYRQVTNPDPGQGLSSSIRLGIADAAAAATDAALIVLADMPRISARHVQALFAAADGPMAIVASRDGATLSPPALFGAGRFAALAALTGDTGARTLLRDAIGVAAAPGELADVDQPDDLRALAGRPG